MQATSKTVAATRTEVASGEIPAIPNLTTLLHTEDKPPIFTRMLLFIRPSILYGSLIRRIVTLTALCCVCAAVAIFTSSIAVVAAIVISFLALDYAISTKRKNDSLYASREDFKRFKEVIHTFELDILERIEKNEQRIDWAVYQLECLMRSIEESQKETDSFKIRFERFKTMFEYVCREAIVNKPQRVDASTHTDDKPPVEEEPLIIREKINRAFALLHATERAWNGRPGPVEYT